MCNSNSTSFEAMRQAARAAGLQVAHLITPDVAVIPSATTAHLTYILTRVNGGWICNCAASIDGRKCWHQDRAAQLAAPVVDKQARYRAAFADVFGQVA